MAIAFVAVSENVGAEHDVVVVPPVTQTDDIMICNARTGPAFNQVIFPPGWTIVNTTGGFIGRSTIAWKRCVGAEAPFTIGNPVNFGIAASVAVYRGCKKVGSPVNASVMTLSAPSTVCRALSVLTTVPNCVVLFLVSSAGAVGVSSWTSGVFGAMAVRFVNASLASAQNTVAGADFLVPTATITGQSTAILSLLRGNVGYHVALAPEP